MALTKDLLLSYTKYVIIVKLLNLFGKSEMNHRMLKKAHAGDAKSQYRLSVTYRKLGYYTLARLWLEEAAEKGYANALYELGIRKHGYGIDLYKLFLKAAEQGHNKALHKLCDMYSEISKDAKACIQFVELYIKKAEQGDTNAHNELIKMYNWFDQVPNAQKKIFEFFLKLVENGDRNTQYSIGRLYRLERKYRKSYYWYKKASEQGHIDAQKDLAEIYFYGYNVKQSYEKAVKLYQKAAEQGNSDAQYKLGLMYCNGQGVKQNIEKGNELIMKSKKLEKVTYIYDYGLPGSYYDPSEFDSYGNRIE